jgi:hypothetical protein
MIGLRVRWVDLGQPKKKKLLQQCLHQLTNGVAVLGKKSSWIRAICLHQGIAFNTEIE